MNKLHHILLAVLWLVSCNSQGAKKENIGSHLAKEEASDIEYTVDPTIADTIKTMELTVVPSTFKANDPDKTAKYIIQNNTYVQIAWESKYTVERWNGSKWVFHPYVKNLAFGDILYVVSAKESTIIDVCLSKCLADGLKTKGKYRLTKEVWPRHDRKDVTKLFAEFAVE